MVAFDLAEVYATRLRASTFGASVLRRLSKAHYYQVARESHGGNRQSGRS